MNRLFNVKFAALFLANSVLYTLFLCTAKDGKNKAIFIDVVDIAHHNKNNYKCTVLWTLRTKTCYLSNKLDIVPFVGLEPTMSNKLDILHLQRGEP